MVLSPWPYRCHIGWAVARRLVEGALFKSLGGFMLGGIGLALDKSSGAFAVVGIGGFDGQLAPFHHGYADEEEEGCHGDGSHD